MKKQKSGIVTTAVTPQNDYLLRLNISQNCTLIRSKKEKNGVIIQTEIQHNVSPYSMQIEYQKGVSLGKLLGAEICKFFEMLQLQKDFKQTQFKLSKPINLEIDFFANGEKYKIETTNEITLKFSGDYAPHNFAKFLFASLLLMTKEKKEINAFNIRTDKKVIPMSESSINSPKHLEKVYQLCDSDISELTDLLKLN